MALESIGVYWIPLYEILEARGLDVVLVNARHVKNVGGESTGAARREEIKLTHPMFPFTGGFQEVSPPLVQGFEVVAHERSRSGRIARVGAECFHSTLTSNASEIENAF